MTSQLYTGLITITLVLSFSGAPIAARAQQKLLTADQARIVDTVSTILTAALKDDVGTFDSVIAPDFFIYDGSARFKWNSIRLSSRHSISRAALRIESDRTRRSHQWQDSMDCLRQ